MVSLRLSLLFALSFITASTADVLNSTGCKALAQTNPALTLFPNSTAYTEDNSGAFTYLFQTYIYIFPHPSNLPTNSQFKHTAFWSETSVLSPWCIFTPHTAQDVAAAVKTLVRTNTKFAVRGGGHMPIPGAASTNSGVLIAMENLNSLDLVSVGDEKVVQVGAGLRWIDVYEWLAPVNLTAIGGRYRWV